MKFIVKEILVALWSIKKGAISEKILAYLFLGIFGMPIWVMFEKYVFNDWPTLMRFLVLWSIDLGLGLFKHWKQRTLNGDIGLQKAGAKLFTVFVVLVVCHNLVGMIRPTGLDVYVLEIRLLLYSTLFVFIAISICDSLYFVTGGKFPPVWVRSRLDKFNQTGNIKDLKETEDEPEN